MAEKKEIKITGQQLRQTYEAEKAKLDALNRQMTTFQNIMRETIGAIQSIDEIEQTKKNDKILVSLGAGVYKEATIEQDNSVIRSISGNVLKKSSLKETKQYLEKKKKEVQSDIDALQGEINTTVSNLNNIARLLNTAVATRKQRQ